jgi:hypothetical protein
MGSVVKVFFQAVKIEIKDGNEVKLLKSYPANKPTDFIQSISEEFTEQSFDYNSSMQFHDAQTSSLPFAEYVRNEGRQYAAIIEYNGECYLSNASYQIAVDQLAKCNGVAADLRMR